MDLRKVFVIGFLFCSLITSGQIKYHDLKGNWISNNSDSLYYKNDTVRFLNTSDRLFCDNVIWHIDKPSGFSWSKCDCCNEPPRITAQSRAQRLQFENGILYYFVNKELFEKFKVLDLSYLDYKSATGPLKLRQLTLLRIK
jgi:hypothetical protein